MPSLGAQNGLCSIILADEYTGIMLPCALTVGHSGGSRGHCYGMTGIASGNVHRTVYSEGERGGWASDEVIKAIQAAFPEVWLSSRGSARSFARGKAQRVDIFLGE